MDQGQTSEVSEMVVACILELVRIWREMREGLFGRHMRDLGADARSQRKKDTRPLSILKGYLCFNNPTIPFIVVLSEIKML